MKRKRWSTYDVEAPARLHNRDLNVGDLLLDDDGEVYRCTLATAERYSASHSTHIVDLRFVCLTSDGFRCLYYGPAGDEADDCWVWHSRVGALV